MGYSRTALIIIVALGGLGCLAACAGAPAPAVPRSAPDDLQATAAWESYRLAAVATQTAAAQEAQAIARALQATDAAAAAQFQAAQATQQAQATRDTLAVTATAQAWAATATRQAAEATATAAAWQVTAAYAASVATATAQMQATHASIQTVATLAAVQATATHQYAQAQQAALRLAREQRLQPLKTYGPWALGTALLLVCLGLGSWGVVTAVRVWDARQRVVETGPFGQPLILLDGPQGRRTVIDPTRFFGPVVTLAGERATMPELAAPEYQNLTTARSQAVALRQAAHSPYPTAAAPRLAAPPPSLALPAGRPATMDAPPLPALPALPDLPADAPWSLLREWTGAGFPLGLGTHGLLVADPDTYPHLLLAGTSGSGKTRYGLRPLAAAALAAGWQVVILDRSGLDFLPFQAHPNAHTQLLPEASASITALAGLCEMIQERLGGLRDAGVSTWSRLSNPPAPRLLVVLDEFANLADALSDGERKELWRYARMAAAEGRKAGVHLALALQDPTHKSLDLRIRRNCLPVSFRVKDGDASRVVLGASGAERLPPRHFLTVLDRLVRGVAFAPSDADIAAFLARRPTPVYPPPLWLGQREEGRGEREEGRGQREEGRGEVEPPPLILMPAESPGSGSEWVLAGSGAVEPAAMGIAEPVLPLDASRPPSPRERAYMRWLAAQGWSKNRICRHVYGFKNGKTYAWVGGALGEGMRDEG